MTPPVLFGLLYVGIGLSLLRPLWWNGDVRNPAFIVLFWPILALGYSIWWLDDKRAEHQGRKRGIR